MKKIIILFASFFGIFFLILLALPTLFSMPQMRDQLLPRINERIPGNIQLDSFRLGWKKGLYIENIVYEDDAKGLHFSAETITGDRGLLSLAMAPKNIGGIYIVHPIVTLDQAVKAEEMAKQGPAKSESRSEKAPPWDKLSFTLLLEKGQIQLNQPTEDFQVVLQDIEFQAVMDDGAVTFTTDAAGGGGNGKLGATGTLNLPPTAEAIITALTADLSATVDNLQIRDFLEMAGQMDSGKAPRGSGVLGGKISITTNGLKKVAVQSDLVLEALALHGGFLGTDTPEFDRLQFRIDAATENSLVWSVPQLDILSKPLKLEANGTFGLKKNNFTASGTFFLSELFSQLPHLLKLREGAVIKAGVVRFNANAAEKDGMVKFSSHIGADDIRGTLDGKAINWSDPLQLQLEASALGSEVDVQNLQINTPFLTAQGQGSIDRFSLKASADLEKAFARLGTFLQLDWNGAGKMQLRLDSNSPDRKQYNFDVDANIADFTLKRAGKSILPRHPFSLQAKGRIPTNVLKDKGATSDIDLLCTSWPGTFQIDARNVQLNGKRPSVQYILGAQLQLDRVSTLLHDLNILDHQLTLAGALDTNSEGSLKDNVLTFRKLDNRINDFALNKPGLNFKEESLELRLNQPPSKANASANVQDISVCARQKDLFAGAVGHSGINLNNHSFFARNLFLRSSVTTLDFGELVIPDWTNPLRESCAGLEFDLSLGPLAALLHKMDKLNSDLKPEGAAAGSLSLKSLQDDQQNLSAEFTLKDFSLLKGTQQFFNKEKVDGRLELNGKLADGNLEIENILFSSSPLSLRAAGHLDRESKNPSLDLSGEITPDLQWLGTLLQKVKQNLEVTLSGKGSEKFKLHLPLTKMETGDKLKTTQLETTLAADHIALLGVDLRDLKVPLQLRKGLLNITMEGQLNKGKLSIAPNADFNLEHPLLRIPENSTILSGVQLEKPLVDGLLGRLHPLFGLLAKPSGQVDMRLDTFTWPLEKGGANTARFSSVIDVRKVDFVSTGFLKEILRPLGLGQEDMQLQDSEITCTGENGRVECTPLKLLVAEAEMIISGSVGFDKTMNYLLQVPVTEKLVGKEGYRLLAGTKINVPIKGTLSQPGFNKNAITDAVADLTKQAAGRAIEKQVEKVLPGLIEGIFGK